MRLKILVCMCAIMATGCAGTPQIHTEIQPVHQNTFKIIDDRPEENKRTITEQVGNNLVRHILGDDRIKPSIPSLIEAHLYSTSKDRLLNKTINITAANVRIYQLAGPNQSAMEKLAYTPPTSSPGAVIGGIFIADLIDIGFTEKRIEVEIEGRIDGRNFRATKYDYYTFGSPDKKALQLLQTAIQEFSDQLN